MSQETTISDIQYRKLVDGYINNGLDYLGRSTSLNIRDNSGNIIINTSSETSQSLLIEPNRYSYTNESFIRAIDNTFTYYNFPPNILVLDDEQDFDLPVFDNSVFDMGFQFNGEIVETNGNKYYIENKKYYLLDDELTTINLLAEKLNKPMLFRINDQYDYDSNYYDYGQLQPEIYLGNTYNEKTETYLKTNEDAGSISSLNLVSPQENSVVEFEFDLVDEINPRPDILGHYANGTRFIRLNNQTLVSNSQGSTFESTINHQRGRNRLHVSVQNASSGDAAFLAFFKQRLNMAITSDIFRYATGWRGIEYYADSKYYSQNTPLSDAWSIVDNVDPGPLTNDTVRMWKGPGGANDQAQFVYDWNPFGVKACDVYGLATKLNWWQSKQDNKRYGVINVGEDIQIAIVSDNMFYQNTNNGLLVLNGDGLTPASGAATGSVEATADDTNTISITGAQTNDGVILDDNSPDLLSQNSSGQTQNDDDVRLITDMPTIRFKAVLTYNNNSTREVSINTIVKQAWAGNRNVKIATISGEYMTSNLKSIKIIQLDR